MKKFDPAQLDWEKVNGLMPAIIQDANSHRVLMLGYVNAQALDKTLASKHVTFYSRTKQRLWTKGEISNNHLEWIQIQADCDFDTLLITVIPNGPVCHTGDIACFPQSEKTDWEVFSELESTIADRKQKLPENSYTTELFQSGITRIAQKVGEEAVEVALAATQQDKNEFCG